MTGRISALHAHHAVIDGDHGVRYWMYRTNLARYHARGVDVREFDDLLVGMEVEFTPIAAGRTKDNPVALDVRVTGLGLQEREGV